MSNIYTAPSNTTFFPKTTGLVFGPRLVARADKGRVFGLDPTPLVPNASVVTAPVSGGLVSTVRSTFTCVGAGNFSVSYLWQYRRTNNNWSTATTSNMATDYPSAVFTLIDTQGGTLNLTWLQGTAPTFWRVRVRDKNNATGEQSIVYRTFNISYS